MKKLTLSLMAGAAALSLASQVASAACPTAKGFPSHANLVKAVRIAVCGGDGSTACTNGDAAAKTLNGGFGFNMWVTVVDRAGKVCDVAYSGATPGDQWLASRVISGQKASTANSLSLPTFALSSANLYSAVQPGGSLYGLQHSNPVSPAAYGGVPLNYLGHKLYDPMLGKRIGGVNVFGGGLALYTSTALIGGIGISGDSSCADHNVAWRLRHALGLDKVPGGVSVNTDDNIINDIGHATQATFTSGWANATSATNATTDIVQSVGSSVSGWGHPTCSSAAADIAAAFAKAGGASL